jgi:Ca-activated chloride channel family protein
MDRIHQRIGSPLVTGLTVSAEDLLVLDDSQAPSRVPDLFPGVPLVVRGRCLATGAGTVGAVTVSGTARDGSPWTERVVAVTSQTGAGKQLALARMWAREHLRDLEDTYVATDSWQHDEQRQALAKRIVETSLRFGVLCRFTAYVAVDSRVVTEGRDPHRVVQPVEPAAGWDMLAAPPMRLMAISAPMPAPRDARARGITLSGRTDGAPAAGGRAAGAPVAGRAGAGRMMRLPKKLRKEEAAPTELADARGQLADELRLLREGQGRPDVERRELLADLASRLDALLRHLRQRGVDETQLAPLVALAAALQAPGPVDDLWAQAVRVLERFEGKGDRRRSFWT